MVLNYINIFLLTLHMGLPIITKIENRKQFQQYLVDRLLAEYNYVWNAPLYTDARR